MSILGRFYFKQTTYGNLLGEFSNNKISVNLTESANIIENYVGKFTGKFKTTWFQDVQHNLNLEITFRENTNNNIYSLTWTDEKNKIVYFGEGFLVDEILIGDYRDFETIQE